MALELCSPSRSTHIPSLVQLCQRIAAAHVDAIGGFGDELRYEVIEPILQHCDAETLLKLEISSPHIQSDTSGKTLGLFFLPIVLMNAVELWKSLCQRTFKLATEHSDSSSAEEPECWRNHFFILREAETRRLEEIGSKVRRQRLEAEDRKKEREVKITDRVPPIKRARPWGAPTQPKTLFQKTMSEASRIQKTMYNVRIIPPMPSGKVHRVLPTVSKTQILPPLSSNVSSRVTVNTVRYLRPPLSSPPSTNSSTTPPSCPSSCPSSPPALISVKVTSSVKPSSAPEISNKPLALPESRPLKPTVKKDPTTALFMPKHRAYSQRPK